MEFLFLKELVNKAMNIAVMAIKRNPKFGQQQQESLLYLLALIYCSTQYNWFTV